MPEPSVEEVEEVVDDEFAEVPVDPGAVEGTKQHEPAPESARWKEVYAKYKDGERKVSALEEQLGKQNEALELLRKHNESIDTYLAGENKGESSKPPVDKTGELKVAIKALRGKRAEAIKDGDFAKSSEITDEIDDLRDAVAEAKPSPIADIDKVLEEKVNQREMMSATLQFMGRAPWYDPRSPEYDPVMAGAANAVDAAIEKDPVWGRKSVVDQLDEIKRRVETRFGYRPKSLPSVGRIAAGGGREKELVASLTPEERRMARQMLGDTPEAEVRYAKQKAATERGAK